MTTQEAIKQLDGAEAMLFNRNMVAFNKAIIMAIKALQEKEDRENPKPLTIEELRQMHGEPVWMEDEKVWGIINVSEYGQWKDVPFITFYWKSVHCDWNVETRKLTCYRHKPKEETT